MNIYKITNLTNLAGKRDFKFNSSLDIEYVDNMIKKSVTVRAGESLFLKVSTLPLSVHRLRVKNLISVTEVSEKELQASMDVEKPIVEKKPLKISKPKKVVVENNELKEVSSLKKKSGKKSYDDEPAEN